MSFLRLLFFPFLLALAWLAHAQMPVAGLSNMVLVLQARGEGVQIYGCTHDADWTWKLKGPEATLLAAGGAVVGKHFAGPAWQLQDGSEVRGKVLTSTPHAGTIPWLVLETTSTGGAGILRPVVRVTRTETEGGVAPLAGCDAQHAAAEVRVAYAAKYSFYAATP